MELQAVDGIVFVFHCHDFSVSRMGDDFQCVGQGRRDRGQGVVAGCADDGWDALEQWTLGVDGDVVGFAMNQFFSIGNGGTEGLANGLVA